MSASQSRNWLRILLLTLATALAGVAQAFDEGIDYSVVPVEGPRQADRIEVMEFFWYGCPHCDHLEPVLKEWKKTLPDDVDFVLMPAPLNPAWTLHSRAYFAGEQLGVADKVHQAFFDAIHREKRKLNSRDELADFYAGFGVDRDEFLKAMGAFSVDRAVRRARQLGLRYAIRGVPALVIDGRWTTSPSQVGSAKKALEITDFLIEKARASR